MYISRIKLHNFKGFKGEHEIFLDKGMNFLVGDNNCGKTSIFEAIDFILTKKERDNIITKTEINNENDFVSVEIEITGEYLEELVATESLKKYQSYLIEDDNGEKSLIIKRSSEEKTIVQSGKNKDISIKNVLIFNSESQQFENPTGIDTTIGALFDAQFVRADTNANDISDFGKTKISGKIISTITKDFVQSETWNRFKEAHKQAFGEGENSLSQILKPVEEKIKNILTEQYGETEVKFSFSLPELENFFKTGNIILSENGIETKSSEKGTGMQRALALALIQIYANISIQPSSSVGGERGISKPIFFFIDEPETFLHPQAQNKLIDALGNLSTNSQIFITTHSPYLLKKYKNGSHSIHIFSKYNGMNKFEKGNELNLFGQSSPSWGEINYYAFGVLSVEFHNELYGFLQAKAIQIDEKYYGEKEFDEYLESKGIHKDQIYNRLKKDGSTAQYNTTLPTKIRNIIHHPENPHNTQRSDEELKKSIESLIGLLKNA